MQNINSFKEFIKSLSTPEVLNEDPMVAYGDMPEQSKYGTYIKKIGLEKYWSKIGKLFDYDVYISKNDKAIIVGFDNHSKPDEFVKICEIKYSRINLDKLKYKNAIEIDRIYINEDYRVNGLAKTVYKFLIAKGFSVVSGGVQFLGARRLWARLSKELKVDVLDVEEMKVLETNHTLEHGLNDFEYPKEYYSEHDFKTMDYRFVLKSIK